uniref:Uncharacterized protein n=1 Tax=Romanomermis culicivorax TaxID=13658 RepID=A0A915L6A5_ROMCU
MPLVTLADASASADGKFLVIVPSLAPKNLNLMFIDKVTLTFRLPCREKSIHSSTFIYRKTQELFQCTLLYLKGIQSNIISFIYLANLKHQLIILPVLNSSDGPMAKNLPSADASASARFLIALRRGKAVADLMCQESPRQQCEDVEAFRRDMDNLVKTALTNTMDLNTVDIAKLLSDLFAVVSKHNIRLETNFSSTVLSVIILEGLGQCLDPKLRLIDCAKRYLAA